MAVRWTIDFVSLRNSTNYRVSIYDDNYSGSPIPLKGGARPFYTEEDADDDFFKPVRSQSGYIKIVDDGYDRNGNPFNWMDMIPQTGTSFRVLLTDGGGTVRWAGFMQAQNFESHLYEPTQERDFPIIDFLGALATRDVASNSRGVVTFGYVLQHIFEFQQQFFITASGSNVWNWLLHRVNWDNFIDVDSDGTRRAKYNKLELLEEICKFWGLTCRQYGEDYYFVAPDDEFYPHFSRIDDQGLNDLANGEYPRIQVYEWSRLDIDDDVYASTDNIVSIVRGYRNAKVTASINRQDNILTLDFSEIKEKLLYDNNIAHYDTEDTRYYTCGRVYDEFDTEKYTLQYGEAQGYSFGSIYLEDSCPLDEVQYKRDYEWKVWMRVNQYTQSADTSYCLRIVGKDIVCLSDGMLVISGNARSTAIGYVTAKLRIGDDWWNGSGWTNAGEPTFTFNFGSDRPPLNEVTKIVNTRVLDSPYPSYDGYGIPISGSGVCGSIYFEIVNVWTEDYSGLQPLHVEFNSFNISFVRRFTGKKINDDSENVYFDESNSAFDNAHSVDVIFASDQQNNFGKGLVVTPSGLYMTTVDYTDNHGTYSERPEEHLLHRLIAYGRRPRMIDRVVLRSHLDDINPRMVVDAVNLSGYPMAFRRDWRDDVLEVSIFEH